MSKSLLLLLLTIFAGRYLWGHELEAYWWPLTYLIEALFILIVFIAFKKELLKITQWYKGYPKKIILFLSLGALARFTLTLLGYKLPWDLSQPLAMGMLLIIAPFLEELLYRGALWILFQRLIQKVTYVHWITSLLFSLSHLHPIWFVDDVWKPMIYFQTFYTLLLGYGCGRAVKEKHSIWLAMIKHLAFNFGFFLCDRLIVG
jgi:membrane protease YdiL (CAAX protease family)